jgi:hypothetical protein
MTRWRSSPLPRSSVKVAALLLWATWRASTAADDLGFTVPLALAHERHCIRLRLAAGACRLASGMARLQQKHPSACRLRLPPALRPHQRHGCWTHRKRTPQPGHSFARDRNQRPFSPPPPPHPAETPFFRPYSHICSSISSSAPQPTVQSNCSTRGTPS